MSQATLDTCTVNRSTCRPPAINSSNRCPAKTRGSYLDQEIVRHAPFGKHSGVGFRRLQQQPERSDCLGVIIKFRRPHPFFPTGEPLGRSCHGQHDQIFGGAVITCVVRDEGNIQLYSRGSNPGIGK